MKRMFILMPFCFILFAAKSQSQESIVDKYAATITQEDLKDYLSILASDALEGRETGTRGQKMAAAFIESHFTQIGLQPGISNPQGPNYCQDVPLEISKPGETYMVLQGKRKENFQDLVYFGVSSMPEEEEIKLVFGGEGQDAFIESLDLKDKGLIIFSKAGFQTYGGMRKKVQEMGAKTLLIVNTDSLAAFKKLAKQFKNYIGNGSLQLPSKKSKEENIGLFFIPPELAADITGTSV